MLYDDMSQLPDHPVIRNMQATGRPDGRAEPVLRCPVCGCEDCFQVYRRAADGLCLGCDVCIDEVLAEDAPECYPDDDPRPDCVYDV